MEMFLLSLLMKIKPPRGITPNADRNTQETSNREFKPGRTLWHDNDFALQ